MAVVAVLQWDAIPAEYAVTHYTLTVDDDLPIVISAESCAQICEYRLSIAEGRHVFRLTATNAAGTSEAAIVTEDLSKPAAPTGLKIVIR